MKTLNLIIAVIVIGLLSCKKETIEPKQKQSAQALIIEPLDSTIEEVIDTTTQEIINLFESNSDDSIYITSNTIDANGYLYNVDGFTVRIDNIIPDSIKVGNYTNEYLVSNVNYGLDLIHTVILGDGSKAQITLGSSATQINSLNVTQVRNDSVWIVYDVDWTYTHWQYTEKNKSGNIKAELKGFKYR